MSILIITNSKKRTNDWIIRYIQKLENPSINIVNNIDIYSLDGDNNNLSTQVTKRIIKQIKSKPRILNNNYLIIYNFNRTNKQIQNALLKTLEESKTKIILQAKNTNNILDTILSRVQIIRIKNKKPSINQEILKEIEKIAKGELNLIKNLLKKYPEEDILNVLEYFLKNNKNTKAIELFYLYKKRRQEVPLNKEIQLTAMFINFLDTKASLH